MKFVPPDTCLADYEHRRSGFLHQLKIETGDDLKERFRRLKAWTDANSPLSDSERLANLRRALLED